MIFQREIIISGLMLTLFFTGTVPVAGGDLVFRKQTGLEYVKITEDGLLITNTAVREGENTIIPEIDNLIIRSSNPGNSAVVVAVTPEWLKIKKNIRRNNQTKAITGDLSIHPMSMGADDVPPAIVNSPTYELFGDISLEKEEINNEVPSSGVYYVYDGVYEQHEGEEMPTYAYEDIIPPGGMTEGRTVYEDGQPVASYFYIKDHLGSVRMTIDESGQRVEQNNYLVYGIQEVVGVSPAEKTREGFTGKEYDKEGNGAEGIMLCYFGKRYYDPDVGHFISVDPKRQFFNPFTYTNGNPILLVDPDGQYVIGAIIGALAGAYLGGVTANDFQLNPGKWDWENPGTYLGMIGGAMSGAKIGSGIEDAMFSSWVKSDFSHIPHHSYGVNAYAHSQGGNISYHAKIQDRYFKYLDRIGLDPQDPNLTVLKARDRGLPIVWGEKTNGVEMVCHNSAYLMYTGVLKPADEVENTILKLKPDIIFEDGTTFDISKLDPNKNYFWSMVTNRGRSLYHSGVLIYNPTTYSFDVYPTINLRVLDPSDLFHNILNYKQINFFSW